MQTFLWFLLVNKPITLVADTFLRMAQLIICSFRYLTCFLMSRSTMMQFQIALTMISKTKTSHTSELQKGFKDSGLQLYYKETASQLISCNECKILKNTYFEKYLRLAASENLPVTAILIFRRNFWSSILLVFHKKHTSWSLFSIKLLIFSLKFLNEFWMNFEYFWMNFTVFILRTSF